MLFVYKKNRTTFGTSYCIRTYLRWLRTKGSKPFPSACQFATSLTPFLFVPLTLFLPFLACFSFFLYSKFLQRFLYTTFIILLKKLFFCHKPMLMNPTENALVNVSGNSLWKFSCPVSEVLLVSRLSPSFWFFANRTVQFVFPTWGAALSCSSVL